MEVYINGTCFKGESDVIIVVFKDDVERTTVANLLINMKPKEGVRQFAIFPEEMKEKAHSQMDKIENGSHL